MDSGAESKNTKTMTDDIEISALSCLGNILLKTTDDKAPIIEFGGYLIINLKKISALGVCIYLLHKLIS